MRWKNGDGGTPIPAGKEDGGGRPQEGIWSPASDTAGPLAPLRAQLRLQDSSRAARCHQHQRAEWASAQSPSSVRGAPPRPRTWSPSQPRQAIHHPLPKDPLPVQALLWPCQPLQPCVTGPSELPEHDASSHFGTFASAVPTAWNSLNLLYFLERHRIVL